MSNCFVIMPLTTPEAALASYDGDHDHFIHVLDHLFIPAIEKAEFDPIKPIAKGSDLIQAEIINHLETADLVLCDISCLNPNVFFELGCRTALNKPVCYVMDEKTATIPFDTAMINHHTYQSNLRPWNMYKEITELSKHIATCAVRSKGQNSLWKNFGFKSVARTPDRDGTDEDKLEYLIMQVEALKRNSESKHAAVQWEPQDQFKLGSGLSNFSWGEYEFFPTNLKTKLSEAQVFLERILSLQGRDLPPGHLQEIKSLIETHINDLTDIIEQRPAGVDVVLAKEVRARFLDILAGRTFK